MVILNNAMAYPSKHSQRGQALIFSLAFAAATAMITLFLFNTGMLANAKTSVQNAADAGAYSAGVLQARDHNFSAYTNRSMVANQVAVAQLVSLKSYLEDAADTHERMGGPILGTEAAFIPLSKPMWNYGASLPIESVNSAYSAVASFAVEGLDFLIRAHEAAQEAHHLATATEMAFVADEVIRRNDPQAELTWGTFTAGRTVLLATQWKDSTQRHQANGTSSESDRFADVVVSDDSTDRFTRNRFSVPVPMWANTMVKPCMLFPNHVGSDTAFGFTHGGGTLLSEDKKRWLALDATLGAGFQSCRFLVICGLFPCVVTEVTPLVDDNVVGGSGGAVAGSGGGYGTTTGYANNPTTAKLYGGALVVPAVPAWIRYGNGPGTSLDESGGLQDYYRDVATPAAAATADQSPQSNGAQFPITIEVERRGSSVRTSSQIVQNSAVIRLNGAVHNDSLRSLSSAGAYFYRPRDGVSDSGFSRGGWQRDDGRTEIANLFSPYWQARLQDRSTADRAASWAAHNLE